MSPKASPESVRGSGAKRRTSSRARSSRASGIRAGAPRSRPVFVASIGVHREVDVRAEVFALGKIDKPREARDLGHEQHAPGAEVVGAHGPSLGRLQLELGPELVETVLGEGEEDQARAQARGTPPASDSSSRAARRPRPRDVARVRQGQSNRGSFSLSDELELASKHPTSAARRAVTPAAPPTRSCKAATARPAPTPRTAPRPPPHPAPQPTPRAPRPPA